MFAHYRTLAPAQREAILETARQGINLTGTTEHERTRELDLRYEQFLALHAFSDKATLSQRLVQLSHHRFLLALANTTQDPAIAKLLTLRDREIDALQSLGRSSGLAFPEETAMNQARALMENTWSSFQGEVKTTLAGARAPQAAASIPAHAAGGAPQ